jgi:Tfp pilus assembly protein FimV
MGIRERIEAFEKKHGVDRVVTNGAWLLFANGAMRELNPRGALCEPPENPWECAKLKVLFREVKLALAVEEFTVYKKNLITQANAALREKRCPPPPEPQNEAVTKLKELQAKVRQCQRNLEAAKAELEASKPEGMRSQENIYSENRSKNSELILSIEQIEV